MISSTQIAENIVLFTSEAALVNATLLQIEGCYILVDSMLRPMDSSEIKNYLNAREIHLSFIVNTHWHSDHCFGNRILKTADTRVIAHELHADTLRRERNMFKPGRNYEQDKDLVPSPDQTFYDTCFWHKNAFICDTGLANESKLHLLHAPGHSPDMIYVYLPEQKIIITGDNILSNRGDSIALPYFFWGDCLSLIKSLKLVQQLNPDIIIPGHGAPVAKTKLEHDLRYLEALKSAADKILSQSSGQSVEALHELLLAGLEPHDLYPAGKALPFWVPAVHELNLKRLSINHHRKESGSDFS